MCTFCAGYGHGDTWYFNLENYLFHKIYPTAEEKEEAKKKYMRSLADTDHYGDPEYVHDLDYLRQKYSRMPGQVITLEEAIKVMEIADEAVKREDTLVVLSRCNCALAYRGQMEYRCIVFGMPVSWSAEIGYAKYPNQGLTEFGGAEWRELRQQLVKGRKVPLKTEEARELLREWDRKGLHHTLVSRGLLPLIDGLCNCEAPYCMRVRGRQLQGITDNVLVKGHYVARIDPEDCTLCGACAERCEFGAIRISGWSKIGLVDPRACFGCGLCRAACTQDAITMVLRGDIPSARNKW